MKFKIISIFLSVALLGGGLYFFMESRAEKAENKSLNTRLSQAQTKLNETVTELSQVKISYQKQLADLQAKYNNFEAKQPTTQTANLVRFPSEIVSKDDYDYKTVRLKNGEYYYGIIKSYTNGVITFVDIFYIQDFIDLDSNYTQQISLIKKGHELDASEDKMLIQSESIASIETLSKDGQVYRAISEYKIHGNN